MTRCCTGLVILLTTISAHAAAPIKFEVAKLEVQRFDTIVAPLDINPKTPPVCAPMQAPDGSVFIAVIADLKFDWPPTRSYETWWQTKTVLRDGDKEIQWTATYPRWCQARKDDKIDLIQANLLPRFSAIYLVPKDRQAFKLSLGDQQIDIAVPTSTMVMDAGKVFEMKIKKATVLSSLKEANKDTPVVNPDGKLLAVTLQWRTKSAAVTPAFESHMFYHHWVSVKDGTHYYPTIGELNSAGKLTGRSTQHNGNGVQTGGGEGQTIKGEDTFVFTVPKDLKEVEITVLGTTMSKGSVAK